jgi:hypothetical protein
MIKNTRATTIHTPKHIIPKSIPHTLSLTPFSFFSAFCSSDTVFFVFYLVFDMFPSILSRVSPYSCTISLSVSYILCIF